MIEIICSHCGEPFKTYRSVADRTPHPTCSLSCARALTPSRKRKRVMLICAECAGSFEVLFKRRGTARFCSAACKNAAQKLEGHPLWKGGKQRSGESRIAIQKRVAEEGQCQRCGSTERLQGHHIKAYSTHPELRADPANIEVLCCNCHALEHPTLANALSRPVKRSGPTKTCVVCGTSFYLKPSHAAGRQCCSLACRRQNGWRRATSST